MDSSNICTILNYYIYSAILYRYSNVFFIQVFQLRHITQVPTYVNYTHPKIFIKFCMTSSFNSVCPHCKCKLIFSPKSTAHCKSNPGRCFFSAYAKVVSNNRPTNREERTAAVIIQAVPHSWHFIFSECVLPVQLHSVSKIQKKCQSCTD